MKILVLSADDNDQLAVLNRLEEFAVEMDTNPGDWRKRLEEYSLAVVDSPERLFKLQAALGDEKLLTLFHDRRSRETLDRLLRGLSPVVANTLGAMIEEEAVLEVPITTTANGAKKRRWWHRA